MSCDHNLSTYCAAIAAAGGPVARAFGDNPALAAQALLEVHGLARARAQQEPAPTDRLERLNRRAADAQAQEQATALLVQMREEMAGVAGWRLPVHGEARGAGAVPLPRDRDAIYGMAALAATIRAAETNEALPILAQQVRYARLPRGGDTPDARMRGLADQHPDLLAAANGDEQALDRVQTAIDGARRFFERRDDYPAELRAWKAAQRPGNQAEVRELTPAAAAAICQAAGAPRCPSCGQWMSLLETSHVCPPKRAEPFDIDAFMADLVAELKQEEQARDREIAEHPPTPAQCLALRGAIDADPTLEEEWLYQRATAPDLDARVARLADRLRAVDLPPVVRHAFEPYQREREDLGDDPEDTRWRRDNLMEALCRAAAPAPVDPRFPAGAVVRVAVEQPKSSGRQRIRLPAGTPGRVVRWEEGFAVIQFDLPLTDLDGTTWIRDDGPDRRVIELGFRPRELERLAGLEARDAAARYQHLEDRMLALAELGRLEKRGPERAAAFSDALRAAEHEDDPTYRSGLLAKLLPIVGTHPLREDIARRLLADLAQVDAFWLHQAVEDAAASLPEHAIQELLARVRREAPSIWAVETACMLAPRVPAPARQTLLAEARAMAQALPEQGPHGSSSRRYALDEVGKAERKLARARTQPA